MIPYIDDWWDDDEDDYVRYADDDDFEDDDELWECAFPGRCCMPGEHTRDECHTPEMAAEYMSAAE